MVVKPFWFLFLIFATRALGPENFGIFMYSISLIGLLLALFEFGIAILSTKVISARDNSVSDFISNAFGLRLISYLIALVTLILLYEYFNLLKHELIVFTLLIYGISNSLTIFFRSIFRGYEIMKLEGISIIADRLLVISLCTFGLLVSPDLNVFVTTYSAAFLLSMSITFILFSRHVPDPLPSFNIRKINNLVLKPGYVFAIMNILLIARKSVPSLLIESLADSTQVGFYNSGYRLLESYLLIPMIFITPLYPFFVRLHARNKILSKLVNSGTKNILLITTFIAIPIFTFSKEFTLLLYGSEYSDASDTIRILMISMYAMSLTVIFGSLVSASDRQKRANKIIFIELVVGIIIFTVLVNELASLGAAISFVIMEFMMCGILIYISSEMIDLKSLFILLLKFLMVTILSFVILVLIDSRLALSGFPVKLLLSVIIIGLMNLFIGTITINDGIRLLRKFTKKIVTG